jgi:hypothetical protein
VRVHVSDPSLLAALVEDLLRGGCAPSRVNHETVDVIHRDAVDAREAQTELRFFLRAWQSRHPGVLVTLA